MARQRKYNREQVASTGADLGLSVEALKWLERDAAEFATRHGINPGRVLRILVRIAVECHRGHSFCSCESGGECHALEAALAEDRVTWGPSLEEALRHLPADDALALFEREDLVDLEARVAIVDYLLGWAAPSQPINKLDELADCLEGFLVHFEVNRGSLIRTGHPEVHVHHLSWLYFRLGKLYYTSLPNRTQIVRMDGLSRGVFRPVGPTGRPAAWLSEDDREDGRFFAAKMQEVAAFIEDAKAAGRLPWDFSMPTVLISTPDLLTHRGIDEIAAEDAARLAASRTKFFELKVKVVRRVIKALRDRDPASLWSDCLSVLTDALTGEEAEFFLRMDRFYLDFDVRTGETLAGEADLVAGGLTDLLEVLGHCEKELTLGTIDRTVRAIAAIQGAESISSYYAAVGQPWRSDLDAALDLFVELESRETAFWSGFRRRVNDALENEFYDEVVIRIPVRRKLVLRHADYEG